MATKKKTEEEVEGTAAAETVETETAPVDAGEVKAEAAAAAEEKPKRTRKTATETEKAENADNGDGTEKKKGGKRAERIGVVSSDKMTKTVVVRVDRLVKHPIYRKYVRRRKKFMAHDELGAKIGDKVKIVATRPLSARKRWRVVEIIQKAEL